MCQDLAERPAAVMMLLLLLRSLRTLKHRTKSRKKSNIACSG